MVAVTLCVNLSSCGISEEATTSVSELQTQVVLSKKNYRVVREVTGESTQHYVIFIGGISKRALRSSAVSDMMNNANLMGSEAIVNVHVQYKSATAIGLWGMRRAIAHGTVIEFTE